MKDNNPILHHYVPQLYLRNFTDNKRIFAYDKQKNEIFNPTPRSVAAEKNFYTLEGQEDPYCIEKMYAAEIEPDMQRMLAYIITEAHPFTQTKTCILNSQQKADLSFFMVVQLLRGKQARQLEFELYDTIFPRLMEKSKNKFESRLTPELEKKIVEEFMGKPQYKKSLAIETSIDPQRLMQYASILYQHHFIFLRLTNRNEFVTSDNPVMVMGLDTNDATPFANGIACKESVVLFPISPKIMLYATHNNIFFGMLNSLDGCVVDLTNCKQDNDFIRNINKKQLEQCYRYIYARSKNPIETIKYQM